MKGDRGLASAQRRSWSCLWVNESQMASRRGISTSAKYPGCRHFNRLSETNIHCDTHYRLFVLATQAERLAEGRRGGGKGRCDAMRWMQGTRTGEPVVRGLQSSSCTHACTRTLVHLYTCTLVQLVHLYTCTVQRSVRLRAARLSLELRQAL